MRSGTRLRRSLRSEASNPRQLKILVTAVKFMEANWPSSEELLLHSERFAGSWIEVLFIASVTENMNSEVF